MPIPVTGGLVLQLETDNGVTTVNGTVTSWADISGRGNHLTGAGDPTLGAVVTPSGAPAIDLDGTGDKLERVLGLTGLPAGNQNRTVFFVTDYVNPKGVVAGAVFGDNQGNQAFGLATSAGGNLMVQGYGGANDFASTTNGVNGGFLVQSAVLQGGVVRQYLNGGLIDTDNHTFATDLERIVLGEEIGGQGFAALKVGAVLVFDRALSTAERGQVETYLQQKYLTAAAGNKAPIAVGDVAGVTPGGSVAIDVRENDIDDGLAGTTITILDGPDRGTITGINQATGVVSYHHNGGGPDSFTYRLTDASGAVSAPATVTIDASIQPLSLDGFSDEVVVTRGQMAGGASFQPISMAFLPDNRMLLLSKTGQVRIVDPESGANAVLMNLTNIDAGQERGLLDITLDPNFATNHHFYLYYTPASDQHARISRFTLQENSGGLTSRASPSSEFVVWKDTDGYLACCHYGGGLDFGIDGKLWLTTSDKFQATTPGEGASGGVDLMLDLTSSSGKIIRVNKDGTIPADNPFVDGPGGNDDSIWAFGLRNPFRARWDAEYGQMYIGEVGGNQQNVAHDDLHLAGLGQKGAFYGWPFYEGEPNTPVNGGASPQNPANFPAPDNDLANPAQGDFFSNPIWSLPHNGVSASLTGGEVYRGNMFPTEWDGVYFYGDYTRDYIRYLMLDATGTEVLGDFAFKPSAALPGTTNEVVSIAVGNDGALYYAMIPSGEVHRVVFQNNVAPEIVATSLTPPAGALPLAVTFSATVTDPDGDAMTFTLNFGDGTIVTGSVGANGLISVPHTYTTDGSFNVSLSVSDGTRTTLSPALEVEAGDVNFVPEIAGEGSDITVGGAGTTEITFTATATDADGDPLSYIWHFGDGNIAAGTVGPDGVVTASHVYAAEGSYNAFLEISDGTVVTNSDQVPIQIGTATQVPVTNGLVLLLESDIKIGLGQGNTVTAWLDGSGQGNNLFAQGNPQLVDNQTPTGKPAIVFDGTVDLLQRVNATDTIFNLPTGNANRTIFAVVDYVNPEGVTAGVVYGDGAANEAFGLVADKTNNLMVHGWGAGNDFSSGRNGVTGGFLVQSVVLSGGTATHYLNGTPIDTDRHVFATDLKKLVLGGEIKGLGEAQLKLGAVLIYNRAVLGTERSQIEAFLQAKYLVPPPAPVPPVAGADAATTTHATAITIDVLANDSDGNNDPLTITAVSTAANGTVAIDRNGTPGNPADDRIVYSPNTGFAGTDSFTYTIADGHGGSDIATVTVEVVGPVPNIPPVAEDDAATTGQGTAVAIDVLDNDSDGDDDPLAITGVLTPANGTAVIDDNGTSADTTDDRIIYTPNAGFAGADAFTYTVSDGKGGVDTGTVTVTVIAPTGGVPVTGGLVAAYQADENVSLGAGDTVLGWLDGSGRGNDLVAAGDPTLVAGATPTGQSAIVFDGTGDLLQRINATDTLNGLPAGGANRTIFLVVDYVNPEGVTSGVVYGDGAKNEAFGLVADKANSLMVHGWGKGNDFSSGQNGVNGGFLVQSVVLKANVASHYLNGALIDTDAHVFNTDLKKLVLGAEIAGLGESQLAISAALIYDRALSPTERAQVEAFLQNKYVALTAPTAFDDAFVFVEDTALSGNVLADNGAGPDTDPNGDPLAVALVSDVTNGTLVLNADGSFSYTPDANFNGVDHFDYSVDDGKGGTDRATVTLTGTPVADPAQAVDDAYATQRGTTLTVSAANGVLANDSDPEGDAFTAQLQGNVAHGTLTLAASGGFTYTPNAGFFGADSFTYGVTGGDTATVTIQVEPQLITTGLVAQYETGATVGLGAGSTVTGWQDGSGRGNHLTAAGNPQLIAGATPTGASAIAFDGTGDLLQRINATSPLNGLPAGGADRTIFFVVDYLNPEGVTSGVVYGDGAQNEAFGLVADKANSLMVHGWGKGNDFSSGQNGVTGGFLVQSVVLSGNNAKHYLNGEQIGTAISHAFNTDLKKLVLGAEIKGLGESQLDVAAALIYDHALSDPERGEVEAYLQTTYINEDFLFT